jgi:hypothetical protein
VVDRRSFGREADPEGERTAVAAARAIDVGIEHDLYVLTARRVDEVVAGAAVEIQR